MECLKLAHIESDQSPLRCVWKSTKSPKSDVNCYDYGARFYDPALGRWHVPDAYSEFFEHQTPYNYVSNNPINAFDPDGNFETKLGAWLWRLFNGGEGEILQDKGGEYFVGRQKENDDSSKEVTVTYERVFDRDGRSEGRDLAKEAAIEAFETQSNWAQSLDDMGVDYSYTDNISDARQSTVSFAADAAMPNVAKTTTGIVNTLTRGGRIKANSLKELKGLIRQLSQPGSELTQKELSQLTKLVKRYGGKIRKDLSPVKGKIRKPHVQVEGLGKSVESRHIWLKSGVS